jgi:hypothetical protein
MDFDTRWPKRDIYRANDHFESVLPLLSGMQSLIIRLPGSSSCAAKLSLNDLQIR